MTYTVRPVSDRSRFTGHHRRSPFDSTWTATLQLLLAEVKHLHGRDLIVEVDVRESEIRKDGQLYANARPAGPGVRVLFESKHGPLSYATDRFHQWQDNVRAIALSLESLRRVDRYGVTKTGEQYAGWRQLPSGGDSSVATEPPMSTTAAAELVRSYAPAGIPLKQAIRAAQRATHPDHGGNATDFDRVQRAARILGSG